ncbi:hypothetical protein GcM3_005008 [Golovinomyces cichoracearum]|uniref:Uncharacterized protein n=1 Tax=Golovinomyces cichoracearum TaxID=62708 RepID=A0A420JAZ0_9PEZI|nr:hypothetical protein GcM3_005008 [Golovinomyces cichoracearum]
MSTRLAGPRPDIHESHAQHRSFFDRPRVRSGFSLRSSHSRKSTSSTSKISIHESHEEKEAKRLKTKTDPSMAMIEVEPFDVLEATAACNTKTTLAPIRAIQHRDKFGNPIVEPDRSNPTRSRWERPLDTIRSFEAAVDGSYKRQSQLRNVEEALITVHPTSHKLTHGLVSSEDKSSYRSSAIYGPSPTPSGHYNYYENTGSNQNNHFNRPRHHRTEFYKNGHTIYSVPDVQESYNLVNSTSGSGSSADPAYSTGPSSENSSIARVAFTSRNETSDGNIDRQTQTLQNQNILKQTNESFQELPDLAVKEAVRAPIKLGTNHDSSPSPKNVSRPVEKRKSWLSKRLSKIL